MTKKWECRSKGCPNYGLTFEWDNADEGTKCRICDQVMWHDLSKPIKAKTAKESDDE